MRLISVILTSTLFIAACANTTGKNSPDTTTAVYKYVGSVQCQKSETSITAMENQLINAGIRLFSSACGNDGKMRITMCGAPDGQIYIFNIPTSQTDVAHTLGFSPLTSLPEAIWIPCRN